MIVALFSGLRASELRGLAWGCVNFEKRVIEVRRRADYKGSIGSPKSKAGNRDVPMSPMVVNTLRQWRLVSPQSPLDLVFASKRGNVIVHSVMHRIWRGLTEAAGLPRHYRFHDLRHTFASMCIEQGWQVKRLQEVMGHASVNLTLGVYGHLWPSAADDQAAMAQIEARLLR